MRLHDPHGHPHATLPASAFAAAWKTETIGYRPDPDTMRASFRVTSHVGLPTALYRSLPAAVRWLAACGPAASPTLAAASPTLAGSAACQHLADLALDRNAWLPIVAATIELPRRPRPARCSTRTWPLKKD